MIDFFGSGYDAAERLGLIMSFEPHADVMAVTLSDGTSESVDIAVKFFR